MRQRRLRNTPGVWKYTVLVLALIILSALAVAALTRTGSTSDSGSTDTSTPSPTEVVVEPDDIVVVGDSNTTADSPDFNTGQIGDGSWVSAVVSDDYRFAGGWARSGSTSVEQAEEFVEVEGTDVLLVMTGTNDLGRGVPFDQTAASLDDLVDEASSDRVVVLAIPPRDDETAPSSSEFNESLHELADTRGWEYFDGLKFLRDPDGGFAEGTTTDGVHLTADAQQQFGEKVVEYLGD